MQIGHFLDDSAKFSSMWGICEPASLTADRLIWLKEDIRNFDVFKNLILEW